MSTLLRRPAATKNRIITSLEIKAKDDQKRTFRGALSTSHLDLGDGFRQDIVYPGAFTEFLTDFKAQRDPYVPLLDSHDPFSILNVYGHMLDAEEKLTGATLRYETASGGALEVPEMMLDAEWQVIDGVDGDRVLDRLRVGSVRKMSMGYKKIQSEEVELRDGPARLLRKVWVREGSLVVMPMNPMAEIDIASVKADLAALDRANLTDEDRQQLRALASQIGALLRPEPASPDEKSADAQGSPAALAPDDRERRAAVLRDLKIRSLTR